MPGLIVMMVAPPPPAVKLIGSRDKTRRGPACRAATGIRALVPEGVQQKEKEAMRVLTDERWVAEHILPLLSPVDDAWQPSDLLPSFLFAEQGEDEQQQQIKELQARAAEVPDDILVCLVGNTVTEEALPTYMTMANRVDVAGVEDATGCDEHGWAQWLRGWTAEENRHGDVLNRYLYLCGRVDMRQVEKTVHHLLRRGMRSTTTDTATTNSAYESLIYGAFQERATFVSHARTAKLCGDPCLAKLCGVISADEKRHEAAYTRAAALIFGADPDGMVRALAAMMRAKITMPGERMTDGRDHRLFDHFSAVAQRAGVYTAADYADMVGHFVRRWAVPDLQGLSGEGRRAQDYVCGLPTKIRKMAAHQMAKQPDEDEVVSFSWVFDRPVRLR